MSCTCTTKYNCLQQSAIRDIYICIALTVFHVTMYIIHVFDIVITLLYSSKRKIQQEATLGTTLLQKMSVPLLPIHIYSNNILHTYNYKYHSKLYSQLEKLLPYGSGIAARTMWKMAWANVANPPSTISRIK